MVSPGTGSCSTRSGCSGAAIWAVRYPSTIPTRASCLRVEDTAPARAVADGRVDHPDNPFHRRLTLLRPQLTHDPAHHRELPSPGEGRHPNQVAEPHALLEPDRRKRHPLNLDDGQVQVLAHRRHGGLHSALPAGRADIDVLLSHRVEEMARREDPGPLRCRVRSEHDAGGGAPSPLRALRAELNGGRQDAADHVATLRGQSRGPTATGEQGKRHAEDEHCVKAGADASPHARRRALRALPPPTPPALGEVAEGAMSGERGTPHSSISPPLAHRLGACPHVAVWDPTR